MRKKFKYLMIYLLLILIPLYVYAIDKVIPGGETIGIEVHSKGVLVVGFYKVDNEYIGKKSGFKIGDTIIKINNNPIYNIDEMTENIRNSRNNTVNFTVIRNQKTKNIQMNLVIDDDNLLKTGLYVKDQINGLGTLSFILEDNNFGGLGHEIMESNTLQKFEISEGEIYDAQVYEIIKSYDGSAGEKNARYDKSEVTGIITENDLTGIYGKYNKDITDREYVSVGTPEEIQFGDATIRTVINDDIIEEFRIKIIDIDNNSDNKNILFEIVDERLLDSTGGVVQGMSGSPIMQNGKMIGVVNYVIVNDTSKGYGIFLTKMLEKVE